MTLLELQGLLGQVVDRVHYRRAPVDAQLPYIVFGDYMRRPSSASGKTYKRCRFVDIDRKSVV